MAIIPPFPESVIEQLCNVIGDTNDGLKGGEIQMLLVRSDFPDPEPGITKRKRLLVAVQAKQLNDRSANNVLVLIRNAMNPVQYLGKKEVFEQRRAAINSILAFQGIQLTEAGQFVQVPIAKTIDEAEKRADRLRSELGRRGVHRDVLVSCRKEFLQENFFHTVFEATKSVAEKIRTRTGLTGDGSELVDEAFAFRKQIPFLALSRLETETQQSEQLGFMNLLKGIFGTFRNVTAHAPKVTWEITERDALDLLTMVSYIHRRLDSATRTHRE